MGASATMLGILIGAASLLLLLFAITLVSVGGFFYIRDPRDFRLCKASVAEQPKPGFVVPSHDLVTVAMICGPIVGVLVAILMLRATAPEPGDGFLAIARTVVL